MAELLSTCQLCGGNQFIGIQVRTDKDLNLDLRGDNHQSMWSLCRSCSFIFQNPRSDRETLEDFYRKTMYRRHEESPVTEGYVNFAPFQLLRLEAWLLYNGINLKQLKQGSCLDFGCGIGGALNFLAEQGNINYGIEVDIALAQFGNNHFPIRIVPDFNTLPPDIKFDLIFSNHAVEHIYDPAEFFSNAATRLKENGIVIVAVPAWRYSNVLSAVDAVDSSEVSMWDHVTLSQWMNKFGFYMTSFLYQNYGEGGDWEIVGTAVKSPRKNEFTFSIDEILKEFYSGIRNRCTSKNQQPAANSHLACRIGAP